MKITSVYIGTVLGAGFASGQEMLTFFAYYGYRGMFGLIITGMLFGFVGWAILEIAYDYKCKSFNDFISPIAGNIIGTILQISITFFMFICFCAMFAGCGALLEQRFQLPYFLGVILMAIGCFIIFLFDVKGIVAINTILAPILLGGSVILGLYMWFFRSTVVTNMIQQSISVVRDNWISSSLIYTSYNILTAVVVLISINHLLNSRFTGRLAAFISGVSLGLIGLILGVIILIYYNDVTGMEIPLLVVVMKYEPIIQYVYIVVLISAMFTTALANGFGIITRLKEIEIGLSNITMILGVIIGAIMFSQIGFSYMVGKVYPIFGYIGLLEIILILVYFIKLKIRKLFR